MQLSAPTGATPGRMQGDHPSDLDTTLTYDLGPSHRNTYSAEGKLLTPLSKNQIKAVEKTLRGKVQKQTLPLTLAIR